MIPRRSRGIGSCGATLPSAAPAFPSRGSTSAAVASDAASTVATTATAFQSFPKRCMRTSIDGSIRLQPARARLPTAYGAWPRVIGGPSSDPRQHGGLVAGRWVAMQESVLPISSVGERAPEPGAMWTPASTPPRPRGCATFLIRGRSRPTPGSPASVAMCRPLAWPPVRRLGARRGPPRAAAAWWNCAAMRCRPCSTPSPRRCGLRSSCRRRRQRRRPRMPISLCRWALALMPARLCRWTMASAVPR